MSPERTGGRLPKWLKKTIPAGAAAAKVRAILADLRLNTVCQSALCPNAVECFHDGTATFLLMGRVCTRNCRFCAVEGGEPSRLEADEPERVAEAVRRLGLSYAVITSVTRDDLADGGAEHFAATIRAVRAASRARVEVLVPDFGGSAESIKTVIEAAPDVFNHNVETAPRLYADVRPQADYERSLAVLRTAADLAPEAATKSGIMVGLGETREEVEGVLADLRGVGVRIVTVGQYLSPSKRHFPVARYVEPEEFEEIERLALSMGFDAAFSGPLVRSSYHAGEVFARGVSRAAGE